jgi:uncharacterized protein YcbX
MPEGQISELWRYPVKSMLGERVEAAEVTEHGLTGDRAFALVDAESGKVCSAKRYDLYGALFECRARLVSKDPLIALITFPDCSEASTQDAGISDRLSGFLGRRVTLLSTAPPEPRIEEIWPEVKGSRRYGPTVGELDGEPVIEVSASFASPGDFFDFSAVHLLTTNTIEELRRREPGVGFDVRRFRPNIVVEIPGETGFVENGWRAVRAGEVALDVLMPVPRCVMTTLAQDDLPRDSGVLRAAARHNMIEAGPLGEMPCAGLYASVAAGGRIAVGDPVEAG